MSDATDRLQRGISEYLASPKSAALKLRMNLAKLIAMRLQENGWTQRRLAHEIKWKESFLSRVIHGDENWTTETAGRVLHALEIDFELCFAKSAPPRWRLHGDNGTAEKFTLQTGTAHGEEIIYESSQTSIYDQTTVQRANSRQRL